VHGRNKLIEEIDEIIYGTNPLFPAGYGLNNFSALVWETIKNKLEQKGKLTPKKKKETSKKLKLKPIKKKKRNERR